MSCSHKLATLKSFKADISSVSPFSEEMEELWVVCVCWYAENGATPLVGTWWQEKNDKSVKWKALFSADMKDKFCSRVLQLS